GNSSGIWWVASVARAQTGHWKSLYTVTSTLLGFGPSAGGSVASRLTAIFPLVVRSGRSGLGTVVVGTSDMLPSPPPGFSAGSAAPESARSNAPETMWAAAIVRARMEREAIGGRAGVQAERTKGGDVRAPPRTSRAGLSFAEPPEYMGADACG